MPDNLEKGLQSFLNQVEKSTKLSLSDRAKITGAGAEAFSKVLKKNTPESHRDYSHGRSAGHGRKSKHLKEAITFIPGRDVDGNELGDTAVGFGDPYNAMVSRFVNNGTRDMSAKELSNLHFKERAEREAKDAVLEANAKAYREVIRNEHSS